ncbi:PREDICTED: sodium-coupled neutral amino acid transporter 4-like [Lupinus angustifolius]|uniref:sodium-coupled neutral amino acid transporter 4-like n=1 Tax=Lupinus angustifolius TaxID=3871 RepID=UPI00092F51E5|nr:PREDICTED: sodium-coupled neutral amino acid transporter 4-like [Lupinus angustifolius]
MNSRSYTMTMEDNKTHNNPKQLKDEESPLLLHGSSNINNNVAEASSSFTGSVFNLSTTVIGAGIMALPAAMKVLGLPIGIGAIIFLAFLTNTSLEILMRFSRVGKAGTYGEVMGYAFGRIGKLVLQISVLVNNFGILVVYMIIIGDVLSGTSSNGTHHFGVLEGWFGECWWTGRTFVLLMTTLLVFAPLGFFKRIDSLRYTSAIAVALAIVFLVITAGITFVKFFNGSILSPRLFPNITGIASIWNLFTAVPVLVTAFVCHYNLHMISNELGDTSLIQPVVRVSLVLCSSIYILTALFGLLLFGESTLDDVLANFDTDLGIPYSSLLNDIVRISYAVHLMLVFPVIFFSLRFNFNDLFFPSASSSDLDKRVFVLITTGLVSLLYVAANFVPSIWIAFQFTGATATVCLGFVFPAAIALRDPHGIATKNDKIISIVMIFLAVFSNVVAIYSNIDSLFRKAS